MIGFDMNKDGFLDRSELEAYAKENYSEMFREGFVTVSSRYFSYSCLLASQCLIAMSDTVVDTKNRNNKIA